MSKAFERIVCRSFEAPLLSRGFTRDTPCVFVQDAKASFGTVWLVEGQTYLKGHFMPRLSIGLSALGRDIAVLSRDLHQLVAPEQHTEWYRWGEGTAATHESIEHLLEHGIPWIQKQTNLDTLAAVLEGTAQIDETADIKRRQWPFGTPRSDARPVNSNSLRFLSYCREAQGRHIDALHWWRLYIESLDLVEPGSEHHKRLMARDAALSLAAAR
jgi:hypothetical protein